MIIFFSKPKISLIIILLSLVILIFLPYAFFWHNGEKLGFLPNIISEPNILNQFKSNELTPSEIAKIPNNYSFQPTNKSGYQYENFNVDFESFFGGDKNEPHRVYFQTGGYFIEFKLIGGEYNHLILSDYEKQKNGQVIYNDILPSTDIRYRINSKGLKEEIILADKKSPSEFLFELNFDKNNTYYKKMPDGLWHFFSKNSENGEELDLYKFPHLYMKDKNGASSDKVEINIFQKNNKDYISIKADKEWLLHPERAYPVIIDPAIEVVISAIGLYTQYPTYRKIFRITSGSYTGTIIILYLSSTTAMSFRTSSVPYASGNWSGETSITTYVYNATGSGASAIMDSSFNVYVAFCRADTNNTLASVKLSFSAGSWSVGAEITIKDIGIASRPQTYPSLAADRYNPTGTGDKIWVAWRYYTGANYSIRTMTTTNGGTSWSNETTDLSTLASNSMTLPHLVKYGEKLAVIYNDQDTGLEWRWREDADADTVWDGPIDTVITASGTIDNQFSVTSDNNNYLHLIYFNSGIMYKKGAYSGGTITWDAGETTISATTTSMEPNISTDGLNLYAFWSEYVGTSQYQMAYKKGANSGGTITWDGSATIIDSHERCFDAYFASISSPQLFLTNTTEACSTATVDVKIYDASYNIVYFGLSEKFDYIYVILSTNGSKAPTVTWAYSTAAGWTDFVPSSGAYAFTAIQRVELWDGIASVPSAWATATVNSVSNYYIRATRNGTYGTYPVGTQLTAVKDNTYASSVINDGLISLLWLEDVPGTTSDNLKFTAYNPSSQYWQWFDDTYDATPTKCFTSDASCPNSNENVGPTDGIGLKNALKLRGTIKENGGIQQLDGRKRMQYRAGTSLSLQVSSNTDDGYETANSTWTSDASQVGHDTDFGVYDYGVRFTNVTIPPGAIIGSAKLQLNAKNSGTSTVGTTISGIDENDTLTWSQGSRPSQRPLTTAQATWSIVSPWLVSRWYESPDITSIVQEIVSSAYWGSGEAMAFAVERSSGTNVFRIINDYYNNTALAAELVVTYYTGTETWYNAGENVGPYSSDWWNSNYLYRRKLTINNPTSSALTDYTVSYQFDHAALYSAGKSLITGNDVRIVNNSGTQIDRIIDDNTTSYGWNLTTSRIWFKVASLSAYSNVNYYIYYGYSGASAPTGYADRSDVFYKGDAFDDSSLSGIWTTSTPAGTISETTNLSISCTISDECLWGSGEDEYAPILYTAFSAGDWYAWVRLNSYTVNSGTHAGIMLYQNRDNVYLWGRYRSGATNNFRVEKIVGDVFTSDISSLASTTLPMWLRIRKVGTTYYFDYSTDGSSWTNQYSNASLDITPTSVGMFARTFGVIIPELNPTFNYFANRYYVSPEPTVTSSYDDWWDTNYLYRRAITIKNVTAETLTNYSVSYQFGHSTLVSAGQSLLSGDDVRIVNDSGTQIDRVVDEDSTKNWNDTDTTIWFRVSSLAAFSSVTYYMYYGYSGASAPTGYADKGDVYLFYDPLSDQNYWTLDAVNVITDSVVSGRDRITDATKSGDTYWIHDNTDTGSQNQVKDATIDIGTVIGTGGFYVQFIDKINNVTLIDDVGQGGVALTDSSNLIQVFAGHQDYSNSAFNTDRVGNIGASQTTQDASGNTEETTWVLKRDQDTNCTILRDGSSYKTGTNSFTADHLSVAAGAYGGINFVNYEEIDNVLLRSYVYPEPVVTAADYDDGQHWLYFNGVDTDDSALASNLISDATAVATHNESGTAISTYDHAANTAAEWEYTVQNFSATASTAYGFRIFDNKSNYYVYLNTSSYNYPNLKTSSYTLSADAPGSVVMTDWTLGTAGNNSTQFPSGSEVIMSDYRGTGANWNLTASSTHLFQSVTNDAPATVGDLNATSAVNQRHLVKYTTGGTTYWVLGYYSTSETAIGFIKSTDNGSNWSEAITGSPTIVGDADAKDNFSMDIDSSGNIHLTYYDVSAPSNYIRYVKLTYSSGSWDIPASPTTVFSYPSGTIGNPVIKLENSGRIWVIFTRGQSGEFEYFYYLRAYYSDDGTTWIAALSLDSDVNLGNYKASVASFYSTEESIAVIYYYGTDDDLMWRYHKVSDAVGTWQAEAVVVTETGSSFSGISLAGSGVTSSDTHLHVIYDWTSGIKYKEYNGTNWTSFDKTISSVANDVDPMVTCYRDGSTHYTWVYFGDYQAANDYQVATQYYDGSAWDSSATTISPTTSKNRRYPAAVEINKTPAVVWSEYDNSSAYNLYSYITKDFIENDEISWTTGTISTVYGSQTSSGGGSYTVSAGAGGALSSSVTAVSSTTDPTADGAGWGSYTIQPTLTISGNELNMKLTGTYSGVITLTII